MTDTVKPREVQSVVSIKRIAGLALATTLLVGCGEPPQKPAPIKLVKSFIVGHSIESFTDSDSARVFQSASRGGLGKDPAQLSFDATGRLLSVLVMRGDRVAAGQAVARLDPVDLALSESSARTQFVAAQAELESAEADFKRYQGLYDKGFISLAEFERRRAQIQLARARFESTSDQLGFITLRALEAGRVEEVLRRVGDRIEPHQVVVIMGLTGRSGTAASAGPPQGHRQGATAGLWIPIGAVFNGEFVFQIEPISGEQYRLKKVPIRLGRATEQAVEVISGLKRGDRIVAAGLHVLSDAEPVRFLD
jgi:multidrug efflux pump subunit AcrA (membrane-fusion protein)